MAKPSSTTKDTVPDPGLPRRSVTVAVAVSVPSGMGVVAGVKVTVDPERDDVPATPGMAIEPDASDSEKVITTVVGGSTLLPSTGTDEVLVGATASLNAKSVPAWPVLPAASVATTDCA